MNLDLALGRRLVSARRDARLHVRDPRGNHATIETVGKIRAAARRWLRCAAAASFRCPALAELRTARALVVIEDARDFIAPTGVGLRRRSRGRLGLLVGLRARNLLMRRRRRRLRVFLGDRRGGRFHGRRICLRGRRGVRLRREVRTARRARGRIDRRLGSTARRSGVAACHVRLGSRAAGIGNCDCVRPSGRGRLVVAPALHHDHDHDDGDDGEQAHRGDHHVQHLVVGRRTHGRHEDGGLREAATTEHRQIVDRTDRRRGLRLAHGTSATAAHVRARHRANVDEPRAFATRCTGRVTATATATAGRRHRRLVARELREIVQREQHRVFVALAAELRTRSGRGRRARTGLRAEQIATAVIFVRAAARRRARRCEQIARIVARGPAGVVARAEHRADRGCTTAAVAGRGGRPRGDKRGERFDLRQRQPVAEAFTPRERLAVDLTSGEPLLDLGDGHRADLILIDYEMPDGIVSRRGLITTAAFVAVVIDARVLLFLRGDLRLLGGTAANDDDVAALLTADLEDLALDLVVGNRVLGLAGITDDLHGRFLSARNKPAPAAVTPSCIGGLEKNRIMRSDKRIM